MVKVGRELSTNLNEENKMKDYQKGFNQGYVAGLKACRKEAKITTQHYRRLVKISATARERVSSGLGYNAAASIFNHIQAAIVART